MANGKNRRVFGRIQIAVLGDKSCLDWLTWLIRRLPAGLRSMPGGTAKLRKLFARTIDVLGLEGLGLTPASLRAGGATHKIAVEELEVGQIKCSGHWASLNTLEHHLQEAGAVLTVMKISEETLARLERIAELGTKFSQPPTQPWWLYLSRGRQLQPLPWTSSELRGRSQSPSRPTSRARTSLASVLENFGSVGRRRSCLAAAHAASRSRPNVQ